MAESEFNLYAVSTRFPQKLQKQLNFTELKQGVYELDLSIKIRLIILSRIEKSQHNAMWHLFSNRLDRINYGKKYHFMKSNPSTAVNLLYEYYLAEGLEMPYTMEEFQKEVAQNHLQFLTTKERVKGLPVDDVVKQFSVNDVVKQFPVNDVIKQIPKEDFFKSLSETEIMAYLKQLHDKDKTKQ